MLYGINEQNNKCKQNSNYTNSTVGRVILPKLNKINDHQLRRIF